MSDTKPAPAPVTLMHPGSKQEIQADPSHVERYRSQGWREVAADAPKGNASLEDWQAYARSKSFTEGEIAGKTRDELRAALA